jgi:hypothetical protein
MQVPDNYSAYESYEAEQSRRDRVRRREEIAEEMEPEDMPFFEEVEE